ncbi:sporulation protein YpjB [Bacillus velezensis]
MDAMEDHSDPLWGSLERPIMATFSALKEDVSGNGSGNFNEKWNEFISLYDLIYPSLTMDVSAGQLDTVAKHIEVIEQEGFQQMTKGTKLERLTLLQQDLKRVFDKVERDDADPSAALGHSDNRRYHYYCADICRLPKIQSGKKEREKA